MKRNSLKLGSVLGAATLCGGFLNAQEPVRPNILFLTCEDISPILGCYGDEVAKTPNLDAFARQGIRHTHMFTTIGVSSPSRYSLITGRYSANDGANYMRVTEYDKSYSVALQDGVKCYPEYMRELGYYCTNCSKTDYQFETPVSAWDECGPKAHWKHAPEGMPFFAIFNLGVTHESCLWKLADKPKLIDPEDVVVPPYYPDTKEVREGIATVYTAVAMMDKQFGDHLAALEESGKADNTIVIFLSDNGGPMPRQKREIKLSGANVPFMIRFPDGYKAGTVNEDFNMFVDIPATILSLAGIETPEYMHGQAMYGRYAEKSRRRYVFGATDRFDEQVEKRASIREERYQYIYNFMPEKSVYKPVEYRLQAEMMRNMVELYEQGKLNAVQSEWFNAPASQEELYDCIEDPHQINNLAGKPEFAKVLKKMRRLLQKEWLDKYCDKWVSWPESKFVEQSRPGGKWQVCPAPEIVVENGKCIWKNQSPDFSLSYQLDGKNAFGQPEHWSLYSDSFPVGDASSLKVKVSRIGFKDADAVIDLKAAFTK